MPVQIVAETRLLRELFLAVCRDADVSVSQCAQNLLDLPVPALDAALGTSAKPDALASQPANSGKDLILFYSNADQERMVEELDTFRAQNPISPLVLVTNQSLTPQTEARMTQLVHAVFPENKPSDALVALLRVVGAGYRAFAPGAAEIPLSDDSAVTAPAMPAANPAAGAYSQQAAEIPTAAPTAQPIEHRLNDVQLSQRERTILQRLMFGASNKSIANDLGICEATVKVHLRTCFRKIGVQNRTQAAIWATEALGPPPPS
ncbi:CsgBAC operon transcriptional regulatory protein [Tritonibacter multivorans]|uniref:CsgBAC operon transcriptional regulatory protein n=1 Tax=Tritonibacter multivorans TaxID=928856 RepID=A0A0N7M123_9RHOB|nr:LuxR C-terminal-related transcriptional regulator [Tritonibacter multivorans]MDA7421621.1 LuxR C-terminal-related transcriptional regulator [Tritonibacter multivorans]CUH82065.1 CsgBAC operon transcriptional regulatory protein [Tritonibacter multivorans]SFC93606.1 regulatory protein, luxR family [Tritonibacter multivorans]